MFESKSLKKAETGSSYPDIPAGFKGQFPDYNINSEQSWNDGALITHLRMNTRLQKIK